VSPVCTSIAQLSEYLPARQGVEGSSPVSRSTPIRFGFAAPHFLRVNLPIRVIRSSLYRARSLVVVCCVWSLPEPANRLGDAHKGALDLINALGLRWLLSRRWG
jgi:hypothetical protein